jgi:hypothetical protein
MRTVAETPVFEADLGSYKFSHFQKKAPNRLKSLTAAQNRHDAPVDVPPGWRSFDRNPRERLRLLRIQA